MASESILQRLEAEFSIAPEHLRSAATLLETGLTPQFLSRYRRDETGDLGEERLITLSERLLVLSEMETRRQAILEQAAARGSDTEALRQRLADCFDQDLLDDIYQSFRPRRAGEATRAEEKGLGPFALSILHRTLGDRSPLDVANDYVSEEKGLPSTEATLEGVSQILAEHYASDPELRAQVRRELESGNLKASALAPDRKGAHRYREFFAFEQPVRRIPAARMLALRRAEREGILQTRLVLPEGREIEIFKQRFAADLAPDSQLLAFLEVVFKFAYESRVHHACEEDVRRRLKEKADRETVRSHLRSLRSQFLAPPLGQKKAMAVRASSRVAWVVVLGEDGSVQQTRTFALSAEGGRHGADAGPEAGDTDHDETPAPAAGPETSVEPATEPAVEPPVAPAEPTQEAPAAAPEVAEVQAEPVAPASEPAATPPAAGATEPGATAAPAAAAAAPAPARPAPNTAAIQEQTRAMRVAAARELAALIQSEQPAGIAVPHGRRHELAERLVAEALAALPGDRPLVVAIDEATAAMHASSAAGRRGLPGTDTGLRTAVSMARRLQDPLLELLSMEHRIFTFGQGAALNEVHQGLLARELDLLITSCLTRVGIDLNRADADLLGHLPGLGREHARAVVDHRQKHGGFKSLADLQQVANVDATRFTNVAGFLRVHGGSQALDATAIHPDNYPLVDRIATHLGTTPVELLGRNMRGVELQPFLSAETGRLRVLDVFDEFTNFGRDPRGTLAHARNEGLRSLEDLKADMHVQCRVTNLTDFGAFVDLGIGHDGLIHVSQIPPSRRDDPDAMLKVGEVVAAWVLNVHLGEKRISLSLFRPRHLNEVRAPAAGDRQERRGDGPRRGPRREEKPVLSRAARAPEGRRGDRRGPKRPRPADGPMGEGERESRHHDAGRGPRRGGEPRVITVESGKATQETLGHKGEIRSLAGLRALLTQKLKEANPESGGA